MKKQIKGWIARDRDEKAKPYLFSNKPDYQEETGQYMGDFGVIQIKFDIEPGTM
jgi:hypothetical protein